MQVEKCRENNNKWSDIFNLPLKYFLIFMPNVLSNIHSLLITFMTINVTYIHYRDPHILK